MIYLFLLMHVMRAYNSHWFSKNQIDWYSKLLLFTPIHPVPNGWLDLFSVFIFSTHMIHYTPTFSHVFWFWFSRRGNIISSGLIHNVFNYKEPIWFSFTYQRINISCISPSNGRARAIWSDCAKHQIWIHLWGIIMLCVSYHCKDYHRLIMIN